MAVKIYPGSVKNIWQEEPPTETSFGRGYMEFRDDDSFSIFDYGTFPWGINGKGQSLYNTSLKFFEILENADIDTHFLGDMGERRIRILLAKMPQSYDKIVAGKTVVYRIPIECVYSKVVTPVSSLHKRLRAGKERPEDYGLDRSPNRGETIILPETKTTFSTKIETIDVYKGLEELARIGGLIGNEHEMLRELTVRAGQEIMNYGNKRGVVVADGKLEFLLDANRQLIVGDTGLSWDENRLLVRLDDGVYVDLSKQLVRNIYTIAALDWKQAILDAQKKYPDDTGKWPQPPDIDGKIKDLCAEACSVVSDVLIGKDVSTELLYVALDVHNTLEDLKRKHGRDETGEEL